MTDWDKLLNWKLLAGSHDFPGKDGGTCINEAAIVAAGMEYREVMSVGDFPPCFSPVLGQAAMWLNDNITNDDERTRLLLPFVTRLAGTSDSNDIEERRASAFIGHALVELLRLVAYDSNDRERIELRNTIDYTTALSRLSATWPRYLLLLWRSQPSLGKDKADELSQISLELDKLSFPGRFNTGWYARSHDEWRGLGEGLVNLIKELAKLKDSTHTWTALTTGLEAACAIGKQPEQLSVDLVVERVTEIRREVAKREPAAVS